jgi:simple sugar transport system substrate-binding protein
MHRGRNRSLVAVMAVLTIAATGCGDDDTTTSDTEPAAAATSADDTSAADTSAAGSGQPSAVEGFQLAPHIQEHVANGDTLQFVYITNDVSSPYTAAQRAGVEKAVAELGVDAELQGPPTGAAQDQVSLIQTLVAQKKVDGIAVAAVNVDSLKPVIDEAFAAGIPFISVFTDQPDSKQLAFVGADNEALGRYEGELLAKELDGKTGKVVALSVDTAAGWSISRMDGLKAGLATNPGLEFVGPVNTGIEPGQMFNTIQNAMQADPDALAIASVDCCSVDGAAKWVESVDKSGEILVVGTDALQETLNFIEDGTVLFAISQNPVAQVFTALSQLNEFVTNNVAPTTVFIEPLLVDKNNSATVTPEG